MDYQLSQKNTFENFDFNIPLPISFDFNPTGIHWKVFGLIFCWIHFTIALYHSHQVDSIRCLVKYYLVLDLFLELFLLVIDEFLTSPFMFIVLLLFMFPIFCFRLLDEYLDIPKITGMRATKIGITHLEIIS